MEENNGIAGGVVCDERILMLVRRDESYSEFFGVWRHEAIVVKIKFIGAGMLYVKVDMLRFSPNFSSQNNREDVWQTEKQRQNQKAPDEHFRLDM